MKTCFTENSVDNCAMISSPGAGLLASVNYTDQLVFSIGRAAWCLVQRPAAPRRLNQSHHCSRGLTPYTGFLRRSLTTEQWKCSGVKGVPARRKVMGILVVYSSICLVSPSRPKTCFRVHFCFLPEMGSVAAGEEEYIVCHFAFLLIKL